MSVSFFITMNKTIFAFMIFLIPLNAFSYDFITDNFFPKSSSENNFGLVNDYRKLYNYKHEDGKKKKLYILSSSFKYAGEVKHFKYDIELRNRKEEYYFNNLSEIRDNLSFNADNTHIACVVRMEKNDKNYKLGGLFSEKPGIIAGFSKNWNKNALNIDYKLMYSKHQFEYGIQSVNDRMHFNWYRSEANIDFKLEKHVFFTSLTTYLPDNQNDNFTYEIKGYELRYGYQYNTAELLKISSCLLHKRISVDLFSSGNKYAHLDNFRLSKINIEVEYFKHDNVVYAIGMNYYKTRIGEESFFDIWPFTFWDVFMCSRTRLKKMDVDVFIPHAGFSRELTHEISGFVFNHTFSSFYNHLFVNYDIIYKERYFVLYPIITAYRTKEFKFSKIPDGVVDVKYKLSVNHKKLTFNIYFAQLVPVDFSSLKDIKDDSDISNSGKSKTWGGFSAGLIMSYNL